MKQEEINDLFGTVFDHILTEINKEARTLVVKSCINHAPFSFDDDFLFGRIELE